MALSNYFLTPKVWDSDYFINRERRNDLFEMGQLFLEPKGTKTVLDFGAGTSPYRDWIEARAKTYYRADVASDGNVKINSKGRLEHPDDSVDVVLSLQVLEHVEDVDTYLKEAYRVLKPGGVLWLTTHGMWVYHPSPGDFWRWTLKGLEKLIGVDHGFEVERTSAMMGGPAYAVYIYIRKFRNFASRLDRLQARVLNAVFRTDRWGKSSANRGRRIKWWPLYMGQLFSRPFLVPLNLLITAIEAFTRDHTRTSEAAIYGVCARKPV